MDSLRAECAGRLPSKLCATHLRFGVMTTFFGSGTWGRCALLSGAVVSAVSTEAAAAGGGGMSAQASQHQPGNLQLQPGAVRLF